MPNSSRHVEVAVREPPEEPRDLADLDERWGRKSLRQDNLRPAGVVLANVPLLQGSGHGDMMSKCGKTDVYL